MRLLARAHDVLECLLTHVDAEGAGERMAYHKDMSTMMFFTIRITAGPSLRIPRFLGQNPEQWTWLAMSIAADDGAGRCSRRTRAYLLLANLPLAAAIQGSARPCMLSWHE